MYKLLSILTPRYCNSSVNDISFKSISTGTNHKPYKTSINLKVKSDSQIGFLRSSTHEL